MQKTPELKPCPFCGGQAYVTLEDRSDPPVRYQVYLAVCKKCGAQTREMATGNWYWNNYTEEDAANAWNRRATQ